MISYGKPRQQSCLDPNCGKQISRRQAPEVVGECPECGRANKIQWRHKKRDWLLINADTILAVLTLLSLIAAFIFAVLICKFQFV